MQKIVSLCKRRGFIFPGSEIYGGLANTWDMGPFGVELKNNFKKLWWRTFVQALPNMVGLDAAILMNRKTWEASGHVASFTDPLVDCKSCQKRFRGDKLLEEKIGVESVAGKSNQQIGQMLLQEQIACPHCGKCDWSEPKDFNLMFETFQGVDKQNATSVFLRPETAQGIFVNFKNVQQTARKKLPFGIGQIGKAFRNEITPGNFTFRTREFEQAEIEFFCAPANWKELFDQWRERMERFFLETLQLPKGRMRWRQHEQDELSHYSRETWDTEFDFPFGWGELWGIAYRTDFDLRQHEEFSGADLKYLDSATGEKFVPHCIEPTFGVDRTVLAILCGHFHEETLENGEMRTVLKFPFALAPVKVAILPLMKKDGLGGKAEEIFSALAQNFACDFDVTGSIGKRYRRQDEIGTPFCVTVDHETLENETVTLRERDSMQQRRVQISEIAKHLH